MPETKHLFFSFDEDCKLSMLLFYNSCVSGVEHSYATGVQLEDQALFRIDADTIAGEFFAIEKP